MEHYSLNDLKAVASRLRVLYVEDEPILREGMIKSLQQLFKEVIVAEDGLIGLTRYQNESFDLVITDISMPNMDGVTMISHIKEINPSARIIVTSAQNDAHKLLSLINLGIDRFLTKPLQKALLIEGLYVVCSSIVNAQLTKQYQQELEQKIRILNTKLKKEYLLSRENTSKEGKIEQKKASENYFEQILSEDLDELRDLNDEIDYNLLLAFQNGQVNLPYLLHTAQLYQRYGSVLTRYHAFTEVGTNLYGMASSFLNHQQAFLDHTQTLCDLIEGFNFTLITFRQNILENRSPNPTFYNASLLSDIQLIENRLHDVECDSDIEFF